MSLVISISGIRGTIGGRPSEGLTPIDTVQFASAYASWLIQDSAAELLRAGGLDTAVIENCGRITPIFCKDLGKFATSAHCHTENFFENFSEIFV